MAQFRRYLLFGIIQILLCNYVSTQSEDVNDITFQELGQFVLKTFNDRPDNSVYSYNSAEVLQAHKQNNSEADYYLKLKFSVSCHPDIVSEAECFPKDLICEVVVTENPVTGSRSIVENDTKCVLPTHEEELPAPVEQKSDSMEQKVEDENKEAVIQSMPPFLLKHNLEHMIAIAEEPTATSNLDERMITEEDPAVEEMIATESTEPEAVEELIVKKKEHCTGCVTDISTDLPELQEFTDEALAMIDENSNGIYKHNLIKITKAQKQVVSGIKYILTLEVAETYCLKTSGQDRETCEPSLTSSKTCVVEFIVKPWRFSRNIISNNCTQDSNDQDNDILPSFESEIVPHFTNMIESQFESEIKPQVDEVKPFFQSKSESDRKGIFDYLDEMDQPDGYIAPTVQDQIVPSVTFYQPTSKDSDFDDIEITEDGNAKTENADLNAEEKGVEKATSIYVDQFKKSVEEQDSSSQSKEDREHQFKDSSSESKESDESEEKFSPVVIDEDFVGGVYRRRREIRTANRPAGWKNIAETEKKLVHDLAELAVRTLDEIDADDSKRVVLEILDAKKQFLDGVMYYLKLRVGSTSCEENKATTIGCLQDQIATPKLCTVQLHRSFAVDSPNDIKVVKSECTNEPRDRHRRSGRENISGGYNSADINSPYIQEMASFAVSEVDKRSNTLFKQNLVRIVAAEQQVVAGFNNRLTLELGDTNCKKGENYTEPCVCQGAAGCPVTQVCRVVVWEQSWTNKRELSSVSCEIKEKRSKRSLVGAPSEVSVNDPDVQDVAKFALAHLEGSSNAANAQKIVKVIRATQQVVAGTNYVLTMELGETTCRKGQDVDMNSCNLKEGSVNQICHVEIWDRPWLNKRQVTNTSCEEKEARSKRSAGDRLRGAPGEVSVNDPEVKKVATFALAHLEGLSNGGNAKKIVRIVSATRQVVSGHKYSLRMEVGETTCPAGQNVDRNSCALKEDTINQICLVEIWVQSWLNKTQVTKVSCEDSEARSKRSATNGLIGGPSEVSVDDPEVREVATFALAHLEGLSNAANAQKLVKVIRATRQVVSGSKYDLTMELGETACRKGQAVDVASCDLKEGSVTQICHVVIWDQPWLKKREVTNSSCEANVARSKRSITNNVPGAPSEVSVNEPEVQKVAKFALAHLDGISNAAYAQKIVKLLHATQQVVAGKKYELTMELGYTTCRKGQDIDVDSCDLKEDSNNQLCHVSVHTRPWLNETRVVNASCSPSTTLTKRSLIGGGTHDIHIGLFRDFVKKHKKTYPSETEYKRRFRIFRANMKKVELLQQTEKGTAKYGATQFADLTSKEFKKYHLGLRHDLKAVHQPILPMAKIPNIALPPEFDWRKYNAVTPVKNQGMCGSCWAFSVTGNVEGQWALRRGELLSLSEQELVDCDKLDEGCKGGLPENAYKSITTLGGLETEGDYPYEGDDETCHFNKTEVKVTITGGVNITTNETKMAQWLVKNGPISIGINANAMQFYMGGVSHPWKMLCNAADLDHGVLIVGYGVHNYPLFKKSLPFWIIKNSWGEAWGEQGYYRVYRGDGTCGVNQMATSAVIG